MAKKPTAQIILIGALGAAIAGALALAFYGGITKDGFAAASRFTARWSLLWFALAWSASSLARLWPGGWRTQLLRNRRGVGLSFAAAHFIHAGFFLTVIFVFGRESSIATIVGGGLGYVFVALMAATSNDWSVRKLGRNWKLLHTIGSYMIAFIFAFTYLGMLTTRPSIAAFGLAVIGGAALMRLAAVFARRRQAA